MQAWVGSGMLVLQVIWSRYLRWLAFLLKFQSDYFPLLKTSLWNKQWRVWPFKGHMGAQKGHWPSCGKGWYSSGHLINAAKMKTQCFKQLEMMWITKKKHIHSVRTAQKSSAPSFAAAIWIANSTNVPHGHSCARARRITLLF